MGAALMCMVGDEDYWDFYTERRPKARKEHVCGECRRTIEPGERYWLQGGGYDGNGFVMHKTCLHCTEASGWLVSVCDGWIFSMRLEDLMSHVVGDEKEVRTRSLVRLVRWMRAGWRDRAGNLRPAEDVQALTDAAVREYRAYYERVMANRRAFRVAGIEESP